MYQSISRFCVNQQMLAEGFRKVMKALSADNTPEQNAFDVLFKHYGGIKSCYVCRPMAIQTEKDFCNGNALKVFSSGTVEELTDDPLFGPFNELILEKATALSENYGYTQETSLRFGYSLVNYIFNSGIPSASIMNIEGLMRFEYSSLSHHISFDTSLAIVKWFIWLLSDDNKYANTLHNKIDALAISKRNVDDIRPYKTNEYNQVEARFRAMLKIIALTDLSDPEKVVPMTEQMIDNVINGKSIHENGVQTSSDAPADDKDKEIQRLKEELETFSKGKVVTDPHDKVRLEFTARLFEKAGLDFEIRGNKAEAARLAEFLTQIPFSTCSKYMTNRDLNNKEHAEEIKNLNTQLDIMNMGIQI